MTINSTHFDFATRFDNGLAYADFLDKHGSESDRTGWASVYDLVGLTNAQRTLLAGFKREMRVVCMAGAWCGDCRKQCPIFLRIEEASPCITIRYVDRDADPELGGELEICAGQRVPQIVFLSEEGKPAGRYGDRTLARYREIAHSDGSAQLSPGSVKAAVIQEWLNEFERIQLMLITSSRLRKIHGD